MLATIYLRGYCPGLLKFGPYANLSPGCLSPGCLNLLGSSGKLGEGLGTTMGNGINGIGDKSRVISPASLAFA